MKYSSDEGQLQASKEAQLELQANLSENIKKTQLEMQI